MSRVGSPDGSAVGEGVGVGDEVGLGVGEGEGVGDGETVAVAPGVSVTASAGVVSATAGVAGVIEGEGVSLAVPVTSVSEGRSHCVKNKTAIATARIERISLGAFRISSNLPGRSVSPGLYSRLYRIHL